MKKILSVLMCIAFIISLLPQAIAAPNPNTEDDLTYAFTEDDGTLTISGTGVMIERPWQTFKDKIEKVVIEEGVTSVGFRAFEGCTALTSVSIPKSVTSIAGYAFKDCTALKKITIPDSITQIGIGAFVRSGLNSISIPNSVTELSSDVFYECTALKSVSLPRGITKIEASTFYGCTALDSISIPEGVTEIGDYAFQDCTALRYVSLPNSMKIIGWDVFNGCKSLGMINLPESITKIKHRAFAGCTSLKSITIPEQVDDIFDDTFANCTSLKTVIITADDADEKAISEKAFSGCTALTKVVIPECVTSLDEGMFESCSDVVIYCVENSPIHEYAVKNNIKFEFGNILQSGSYAKISWTLDSKGTITFSGEGEIAHVTWSEVKNSIKNIVMEDGITGFGTIFEKYANVESIRLPNTLTSIEKNAFAGCRSLKKINIPAGVKELGDYAFMQCFALKEVTLPNGLEVIGKYTFYDCTSLESVNLPEGLREIKWLAFQSCESLKEITFPASITLISQCSFRDCTSLEKVTFTESENTITIEVSLFENCTALKDVKLVKSINSIGGGMFRNCTSLTEVVIPDGIKTVGGSAFLNCTSLAKISLPDSVTFIGLDAFDNTAIYNGEGDGWENGILYLGKHLIRAKTDITTANIKDGTLYIAENAFRDCAELSEVTFPKGILSFGMGAFYNCDALVEVAIPDSVTSIDNGAFAQCDLLEKLTIPKSVTTIGGNTSIVTGNLAVIYCYDGSAAHIHAKEKGLNYVCVDGETIIPEFPVTGTCGDGVNWVLTEDKVLTFSGKGEMICYPYSPTLWDKYKDVIKEVIINPGVVGIDGTKGFNNLVSMVSLTIPADFYGLQPNTFANCTSLENINLPDDLEIKVGMFNDSAYYKNPDNWEGDLLYIGKHLVACKNKDITEVTVKNGTASIADEVFRNCAKLEKVNLPNGLRRIGENAFLDCTALKEISMPESINQIGPGAFVRTGYYNDENNWENDLLYIGKNLLYTRNESEHSEVNIKEGTRLIADMSVASHYLTTVTIPNSVKFIGNYVFYDCSSLETVSIPSGVTRIGHQAFWNCDKLKEITIPQSVNYIGKDVLLGHWQLTVSCYAGTVGHQYVIDNNIPYKLLGTVKNGGGGGGGSSKPKPEVGLTNFKAVNEYTTPFTDVKDDAWYYDSVKTAFELDLVKGAAEGKYNPEGNVTIAEAITLAARIHNIYTTGKSEFIQGDVWYQVYVDYAIENGIITDGEYTDVNAPATRAQFAKIFAKAIPESDFNAINSIEAGKIPDVAEDESVYLLYNAGILAGSDEVHSFKPESNIKRSEVATIVTRIVDKTKRITFEIK